MKHFYLVIIFITRIQPLIGFDHSASIFQVLFLFRNISTSPELTLCFFLFYEQSYCSTSDFDYVFRRSLSNQVVCSLLVTDFSISYIFFPVPHFFLLTNVFQTPNMHYCFSLNFLWNFSFFFVLFT